MFVRVVSVVTVIVTSISCLAPTGTELQPAVRDRDVCARTIFTSWDGDDIPTCDMDGSQTWILSDEVSDLDINDPTLYCNDRGGTHAVSPTDPTTHYCINLDY